MSCTWTDLVNEAKFALWLIFDMPRPIDELLSNESAPINDRISKSDINSLRQAGFATIESIIYATRNSLLEVEGISERKYGIIFKKAIALCSSIVGFKTAQLVHQEREDTLLKISTGSNQLDVLLDGGIELGSLTELYGHSGSGKTQLCHTLAVTCQLSVERGGLGNQSGRCIYIDSERTFRLRKIRDIALRFDLNPNDCLENILIATCHNSEHQEMLIKEAASLIVKDRYSLVIVDSMTHTFRGEFHGFDQLAPRQQLLGKKLRLLKNLASLNNCACVITNQMVDDVSGLTNKSNPVGGHILAHASTTRLLLSKEARAACQASRICRIIKSPYLPEEESLFAITDFGIKDVSSTGVRSGFLCANVRETGSKSQSDQNNNNPGCSNRNEGVPMKLSKGTKTNNEFIQIDNDNGEPEDHYVDQESARVEEVSFTQVMTQVRSGQLMSRRRFIGTLPPPTDANDRNESEVTLGNTESDEDAGEAQDEKDEGSINKDREEDDDGYTVSLQDYKRHKV